MTSFLLDTNTLSDIANDAPGWERIVGKIALYGIHRCAISAITWHELRFGRIDGEGKVSKEKLAAMDAAYSLYEILPFDADAAAEAVTVRVTLRKIGKPIGLPDVLIAGHALAAERVMITANVREFGRVPGLTVRNGRT